VKELTALKTRPNTQDGSCPAAGTLEHEGAVDDVCGADPTRALEGSPGKAISAVAVSLGGEEVDEARTRADGKTDVAMTKLNYYKDIDDMVNGIGASVMPHAKVLIHVDAPTSKQSIVSKLIDKAEALFKVLPTKKVKVAEALRMTLTWLLRRSRSYLLTIAPYRQTSSLPPARFTRPPSACRPTRPPAASARPQAVPAARRSRPPNASPAALRAFCLPIGSPADRDA